MEEPPDQRGPSLLTYALVTAFVLAVVIGILITVGQINPSCHCTDVGEGACLSCGHIMNAL